MKGRGLRRRDALAVHGPHETLHDRFARRSRLGVVARRFGDRARAEGDTLMTDGTHLKAHRTAASLEAGDPGRGRSAARRAG